MLYIYIYYLDQCDAEVLERSHEFGLGGESGGPDKDRGRVALGNTRTRHVFTNVSGRTDDEDAALHTHIAIRRRIEKEKKEKKKQRKRKRIKTKF